MRNLVRRYVTQEQRKAENEGVTEDDVNEIKNDISAFRFEMIEIMRASGMNTQSATGPSGKIWFLIKIKIYLSPPFLSVFCWIMTTCSIYSICRAWRQEESAEGATSDEGLQPEQLHHLHLHHQHHNQQQQQQRDGALRHLLHLPRVRGHAEQPRDAGQSRHEEGE